MKPTIKRIHINQHNIRYNSKNCEGMRVNQMRPVVSVKTRSSNTYGVSCEVNGKCTIIYSPDKPLSCGAKVWIETEDTVVVNRGNDDYVAIY